MPCAASDIGTVKSLRREPHQDAMCWLHADAWHGRAVNYSGVAA